MEMTGLKDKTIPEFTQVLASKEAVPGGGGASALVGAVGVALGNMVGSLTVGKKKYAAVEPQILALMEQAKQLQEKLLTLIDGDAACFAPLAKAYSIPKDDPTREAVMEDALRLACSVPMDIMRAACEGIRLMEDFAAMGSVLAISDAGVGAVCCKAALQGASLNVFINTKSMKDRAYAQTLESEAQELLDTFCPKADGVYAQVVARISG